MPKQSAITPAMFEAHVQAMYASWGTALTRANVKTYCTNHGLPVYPFESKMKSVGGGFIKFEVKAKIAERVPQREVAEQPAVAVALTPELKTRIGRVLSDLPENCVPEKDPLFVPYGNFEMYKKAVSSRRFFTLFIRGDSGFGKTTAVEQVCSSLNRELVLVQITKATTEAELVGDFRLLNGETPFYYGPVAEAMRRGAVLLLDELTQADATRIMCLQNVLAGKPLYIKKTGEIIKPAPGFCVIATGNSVGEGDDNRNQLYVGEEILNEAFRDRFTAVMTQEAPPAEVEQKILCLLLGQGNEAFAKSLVRWAHLSRESFRVNKIDRQISTRRLVHICSNYAIFGDKLQAIEFSLARFRPDLADSLRSSYFVIDPSMDVQRMSMSNMI